MLSKVPERPYFLNKYGYEWLYNAKKRGRGIKKSTLLITPSLLAKGRLRLIWNKLRLWSSPTELQQLKSLTTTFSNVFIHTFFPLMAFSGFAWVPFCFCFPVAESTGMIWAGGIPSGTPNTGCGCKACALRLVPRWNLMGFPGNANSSREREVAALARLMRCPWISIFWVRITVIPGNSISQQATPGQDSSASPAGTSRSAGITSFPFTWDKEHIRHWDESFTDQTLPTSNSHGTHRPEQNSC